jgi:hypothetical protein
MNREMSDREWMQQMADDLDEAARFGVSPDDPEGVMWIQISHTLARQISERLREIAGRMPASLGPHEDRLKAEREALAEETELIFLRSMAIQ